MNLPDKALVEAARQYKRAVASRYRAIRPDELATLPHGQCHVSPKIDGQLWFVSLSNGKVCIFSHTGTSLPLHTPLAVEVNKLLSAQASDLLIAGELWATSTTGRPRSGDTATALGSEGDTRRLAFMAFDLLSEDGSPAPPEYAGRLSRLVTLFEGGKRAKVVPTHHTSHTEATNLWQCYGASGKAEGIIVRSQDGRTFKVKPTRTVDCVVLGFTERTECAEQVRSVLLGLTHPDGSVQVIGACGSLGSDDTRRTLHARLAPLVMQSRFRRSASSGAIYRMVEPEVVLEVEVTDLQCDDSQGVPISQTVLVRTDTEGWLLSRQQVGASLIHPRLGRLRPDKRADPLDTRFAQLTEYLHLVTRTITTEPTELPPSTLLRREVYTKTTKGRVAVRKLLVWRTNKDKLSAGYSSYVVHFTDFSPTRKTPLARTCRRAPTEAEATALAEALIAKNIKRGWKRAEP